jgi:ribosomal 50S subunit-associated protein YjgA (DUF615 family)
MNSDFKDLLRCLNEYKVKYLVIGGYAVSFHTEPRYTKDLDIWIEASKVNAKKTIKALEDFGAPVSNLNEADFEKAGTLYVFGIAPNRVDILNRVKGTSFANAWKNRTVSKIGKLEINFISKEDLKKQKKAAGRLQDLVDLEKLKLS